MRILWQLSAVNAARSGARHRTFKSMSLDCFFELLSVSGGIRRQWLRVGLLCPCENV